MQEQGVEYLGPRVMIAGQIERMLRQLGKIAFFDILTTEYTDFNCLRSMSMSVLRVSGAPSVVDHCSTANTTITASRIRAYPKVLMIFFWLMIGLNGKVTGK